MTNKILTTLLAAVVGLVLVPLAGGAGAAEVTTADGHGAPTFELYAPQPERYVVNLALRSPRAVGSRLDRATVSWGDGAVETRDLSPLLLYTSVGFQHRYEARPQHERYGITVRLYDVDGFVTTKSRIVTVWPRYDVTINPVKLTSTIDCDFWSGDGEFDVYWRQRNTNDHRTLHASFDLGQGESAYWNKDGVHAYDVGAYTYPVIEWYWFEDDFGLDPPMPGTFPLEIHGRPRWGTWHYSGYDTFSGCSVRWETSVTSRLVRL
jgi:hypothetical protein